MSDNVSHETLCLTPAIKAQIEQRRAGVRKKVHHHGLLCSKCLEKPPASENDRYCKRCRADDRKERRRIAKEANARNAAIAAGVLAVVSKAERNHKKLKGYKNGQSRNGRAQASPHEGEPCRDTVPSDDGHPART